MFRSNIGARRNAEKAMKVVLVCSTYVGIVLLVVLLARIFMQGLPFLTWEFLSSFPSRKPAEAGILAALAGSLWLIALTIVASVPVGIMTAIYLEEYAPKNRLTTVIDVNIANLAGVPSIIYGILGLGLFVRWMELGRSVLAGAFTMTLVVLPVIIIASREALRAVPDSMRLAAFALGATRWQTIWHHVLPAAIPGILTGVILSLSRAIGETAPLIMIGALTYVAFTPKQPLDMFTALPIQIFNWASRPQADFLNLAAAGIIVLLAVLLTLNSVAILIRNRFQKYLNW
jgi:phosphate transport system permease protein